MTENKGIDSVQAAAVLYRRLAEAFNYPDSDLLAGLTKGVYFEEIAGALKTFGKDAVLSELESLRDRYRGKEGAQRELLIELERDYTWMCYASKPRQVYLFESVYREGKLLQESTFQIARLYVEAGLKMSDEFKLPPDHIAVELEFMAYLYFNEAEALKTGNDENLKLARQLQDKALKEHLGPFGPAFAQRMEMHAKTPFYRTMARVLAAVLGS
jgi:TorA maturation chaperone TorD